MEPAAVIESQAAESSQQAKTYRVPRYDLGDSVAVADAIHKKGGGSASRAELAAYLDYKTTNSGAFNSRLGAARLFGLVTANGSRTGITPLAQKIITPVYPEQTKEGLIEAFFNVPIFKELYEVHDEGGKQLPPGFGFKNLLRNQFGLSGPKVNQAHRTLMASADLAGFFDTRGRTHLIVPTIRPSQGDVDVEEQKDDGQGQAGLGGGGGGSDGRPPSDPPSSAEAVRLEYVRKLISMVGNEGVEDQQDLMERIEKLLAVTEGGEAAK